MARFILNSAVITTEGTYTYRLISLDEARKWAQEPFISAIGYEETAQMLAQLLGVVVGVNRQQIKMSVGDEALVCRLKKRIEPAQKGSILILNPDDWELGLLKREV